MQNKRWRPDDWKNPYKEFEWCDGEIYQYTEPALNKAYEAGADALLTFLLDCGITSISQLEALNKSGDNKRKSK